jgi:3-methyladenine DNA glycosylase Tag
MIAFKAIRARAAKRKGGETVLASLLPKVPSQKALAKVGDDRVLSEMAQRIFSAGFVWSVIEKKWPGFEAAFLGFDPRKLAFQPDEFWEGLLSDKRIVRNPQKIKAVRDNAAFVLDIAKQHGSFGKFLGEWPADDQVGLLELLAKRGARLGGNTGQYFLRFIGKDVYIASVDMIACLRDAGLDISGATSKKDQRKIQDQLNAWAKETGLPYTHLSRICAMSIGENYDAETLRNRGGGGEE